MGMFTRMRALYVFAYKYVRIRLHNGYMYIAYACTRVYVQPSGGGGGGATRRQERAGTEEGATVEDPSHGCHATSHPIGEGRGGSPSKPPSFARSQPCAASHSVIPAPATHQTSVRNSRTQRTAQ